MTARPTRKRLWRKRLTRAILCLLLGAVTAVGVAWGLALSWSIDSPSPGVEVEGPMRLVLGVTMAVGAAGPPVRTTLFVEGVRAGWPLPCLEARAAGYYGSTTIGVGGPWNGRIHIPEWMEHNTSSMLDFVPGAPIFPGFLLNTLFYAAPWWLILITPGAVKRMRRRRRGRCIHCGYDLAGLRRDGSTAPTCPECGA